jgi:hypothetical protein
VLARLTFATDPNAAAGVYPISVTFETHVRVEYPINADEDELDIDIINGEIRITTFTIGSVTGSGNVAPADLVRLARYLAGHNVTIDDPSRRSG